VRERVSRLVRKLDAGKPPVQFDERGVETERLATAPLLDSTSGFPLEILNLGTLRVRRCRQQTCGSRSYSLQDRVQILGDSRGGFQSCFETTREVGYAVGSRQTKALGQEPVGGFGMATAKPGRDRSCEMGIMAAAQRRRLQAIEVGHGREDSLGVESDELTCLGNWGVGHHGTGPRAQFFEEPFRAQDPATKRFAEWRSRRSG
jgi:hypothetical protein